MRRIFFKNRILIALFCLVITLYAFFHFDQIIRIEIAEPHPIPVTKVANRLEDDDKNKKEEAKTTKGRKFRPKTEPKPECACLDPETGIKYDFCYHFGSTIGQKFDCSYLPHLKILGLIDYDNVIDLKSELMPNIPTLVSAASSSHWTEEERLISLVQKFLPNHKMVLYDIGLNAEQIKLAQSYCQVELRTFQFDKYPKSFRRLLQFRWKPVIIAEALKEFGAVWYMDSSVTWKKKDLSHVYALLNCRSNPMDGPRPVPVSKPDPKWVESGFHMDLWRDSLWKCDKYAYMMHGWTGHGIFPATHPDVYKYIPTDLSKLSTERAKMYEAGFIFAVRTEEVIDDIMKWYVLCALEEGCMGPPGAGLGCRFKTKDRFSEDAHCHRFDQSIVNLLLANVNHFDSYYYVSGIVDFFNIVRGGHYPHDKDHMCKKDTHLQPNT